MKVLIVSPCTEKTKGGMASVVKNILSDKGLTSAHELTYVASHVEGTVIRRLYTCLKAILYILFKSRTYDIMHIHMASFGSFYRKSIFVMIGRLLKKRIILHMHGAEFDDFFSNSPATVRKLIVWIFGLSHKTIVLSDSWKDFFEKNIVNKNVVVLKNGVDVGAMKQCINTGSRFNTYVFLGRLGVRKGVYDLLEALKRVVEEDRLSDIRLYLAGDGEIEKVQGLIGQYSLQKNVVVTGWIESSRKNEILKESDIMILPSYDEGLPVSLVEGLASGKVVISTEVGGIPELIQHGINGFLIKPGDIESLRKYIVYTNTRKDEMKNISSNNILKAEREYDLKNINKSLCGIYTEVVREC